MEVNTKNITTKVELLNMIKEEAEEQKKIYDLWKKKLDADLKEMKK